MSITQSCTGCGACTVICPQKCIQMKENILGEYTPHINEASCVRCGLCKKTCPQNNQPDLYTPQLCYAAWSENSEDWIFSSSGGVGACILRFCLKNGISAYSCDYDYKINLRHFRIQSIEDVRRAQSSKYSQSNSFLVFEEIKKILNAGEQAVFIGTPCQVAGLRKYLKKAYSGLITVDLVCHGTPPTKYVRDHLSALRLDKQAKKIRFRGEYDQCFTVWNDDSIVYKEARTTDSFFKAFYANEISRESCYSCQYARADRPGDITIGDFWGLHDLKTIERKSERPSLVLLNTEKGKSFFEGVKPSLFYEERNCQEGIAGNGRLKRPPGKNRLAKYFRALYPVVGFENALSGSSLVVRVINKVKK